MPWPEAQKADQVLGVRPESFKFNNGDLKSNEVALGDFTVELSENLGGQQMLHGQLEGQSVRIITDSMDKFSKGQKVSLKIDLTKAHLFDKKTGQNQRL
jgi:ABC-type sugar transport system ATPase subunit